MGINITAKTDYSFLFSGLKTGSSSGANLNFLSDYASIKNGSYGKLMKAYYNETGSSAVNKLASSSNKNTITKTEKTALTKVQTATDALKESADVLLENGRKSVFAQKDITTKDENGVETTAKGYDTAAIYKAVNDFVSNYNSVINAANDSENDTIIAKASSLATSTYVNSNLLSKIGITMNEDSTLSIDKDTFMKADMNTVKSVFNGNGSYGYRASAQASLINFAADREASRSNTYTLNGTLNTTYNSGNLFDSIF